MKNCIIYLLIFYSLISCKCDKECVQFTSEELSWLPYKMGDTLKFKGNLGSEDTWVVTNTYHEEGFYGETTGFRDVDCELTYYSAPHFELLHVYEQKKYIFFLKKYQDDLETIIFNTIRVARFTQKSLSTGSTIQNQDSIYFNSIGSINETVQNLSIKKNIGISQYTLNETNEIYEKY